MRMRTFRLGGILLSLASAAPASALADSGASRSVPNPSTPSVRVNARTTSTTPAAKNASTSKSATTTQNPTAPTSGAMQGPPAPPTAINYVGGPPLIGIPDQSGVVAFLKEQYAPAPALWAKAVPAPHTHYCEPYCADINAFTKNYPLLGGAAQAFGPGRPFKVLDRFIWPRTGGAVYAVLADGTTFGFGHLNVISERVYYAAKMGLTLPAGTWIGSANKLIGVSTGPHIHIQAWTAPNLATIMFRKDWLPALQKN